jgi:hypothetical protein
MRSRSFCSAQTALVDFLTERNGESAWTDEEFASSLLKIVLNYNRYLDRAILWSGVAVGLGRVGSVRRWRRRSIRQTLRSRET